jgi:hypothetical protein
MSNPFDDVGGTNPFDDSMAAGASTSRMNANPFNTSSSSFDDDGIGAATTGTAGEEDNYTVSADTNDDLPPPDAPVEASWQYLGDLPYRRVPIYNNIRWGTSSDAAKGNNGEVGSTEAAGDNQNKNALGEVSNYGLSAFPMAALQRHPDLMNPRELRDLLNSSTVTKVWIRLRFVPSELHKLADQVNRPFSLQVVGCPYGGPIAAVTLPIIGETSWFTQTEIRILTNSGRILKSIDFPLPGMERKYSPSDILEIGFTDRTALIIILKDSLCLTYDLSGEQLLPPFHILPRVEGQGMELLQATIFEGGAVSALNPCRRLTSCPQSIDCFFLFTGGPFHLQAYGHC